MGAGKCAWHVSVPLGKNYAHIHITKADYKIEGGYWVWTNSPRIGIDFRETKDQRGEDFVSNIDAGDLVRLIKILKLVQTNRLGGSKNAKKPNTLFVEQTFRRAIRLDLPTSGGVDLSYRHTGWKGYRSMAHISGKKLELLVATLARGLNRYLKLISEWAITGKLPTKYRNRVSD